MGENKENYTYAAPLHCMFVQLKFSCMSRLILLSFLCAPIYLFAQTNMTFRSVTYFTGHTLANVWGYTAGGHEYALIGEQTGTVIMDITNPDAPNIITTIPGPNNLWKEIKT